MKDEAVQLIQKIEQNINIINQDLILLKQLLNTSVNTRPYNPYPWNKKKDTLIPQQTICKG